MANTFVLRGGRNTRTNSCSPRSKTRSAPALGLGMRRAVERASTSWEAAAAVVQARRLLRSHPAAIRVCWDLDNTLVDSGSLLREGRTLQEAIIDARPVPNML